MGKTMFKHANLRLLHHAFHLWRKILLYPIRTSNILLTEFHTSVARIFHEESQGPDITVGVGWQERERKIGAFSFLRQVRHEEGEARSAVRPCCAAFWQMRTVGELVVCCSRDTRAQN